MLKSLSVQAWPVWIAACLIELLGLTFLHNAAGPYVSPLLILAAGLMSALLPLLAFDRLQPPERWTRGLSKPWQRTALALGLLQAALLVVWLYDHLAENPATADRSDVIPQIQTLLRRFLSGEDVYAPITEWGYTLLPTYPPGHWLAFAPAEFLGIDYRAYVLGVTALVWGWFCWTCFRNLNGPSALILAALPWLALWGFAKKHPSDLCYTVETLPACWYLLLTLNAGLREPLAGVFVGLSLVSRYTLALWAPVWAVLVAASKGIRASLTAAAIALALLAGLYVVPFLLKDPGSLKRGMEYHTKAALGEWKPQGWQKPEDKPYQLFRGIGMAAWFHDQDAAKHPERLALLQRVHFALSLIAAAAGLVLGYRLRRRVPLPVILAATLKLYLVVFYGFIQIPYSYLFWVPLAVGWGLMFTVERELANRRDTAPA